MHTHITHVNVTTKMSAIVNIPHSPLRTGELLQSTQTDIWPHICA